MKVEEEDNRIIFRPETLREAYNIGRLSKVIQNTTTLEGEDVKIEFGCHEVLDMARQIEENPYKS